MKKWTLLFIAALMLAILTACGDTEEATETVSAEGDKKESVTIKHELGEATVPVNPKNVVVFDFGVLDTLDELGVEVAGVPQASIPDYLEKYKGSEYTNVGSLKEADFEAIHAMNPEVIFISARQAEMYDEYAKIAPTVYVPLDYTNYMDSFTKNMETIATIFDKEDEMKAELEEVNATIESIHEKASALDEKALIVLSNEGKVSAYGPSSRFGILHDVFGFTAADEGIEQSTHGQNITFEYILETNPGILFVIDRDAAVNSTASAKGTIENELVEKTDAFKNDKIFYLNPGQWYLSGGGLQSVKLMVKDAEAAL
jgi:iron complex transport system substrate-binding protein